jgi:hypothetical protein
VSENGPREGTRDLPRRSPDAGHRSVDDDSVAGTAYGILSRSLRRRRAELVALMEAGGAVETVASAYQAQHPLEPAVSREEIEAAVNEAKSGTARTDARVAQPRHRPLGPRDHSR